MPKMIYGTAWKKEETTRLVELALSCGFRAIDTACQPKHYREDLVGVGLQNAFNNGLKREDVFIQTKFTPLSGQNRNNMPYLESDDVVTQVEKSFCKSKENLGVSFIDSYILHSPIFPLEDLAKVYKRMESFVLNGEVGQIGISNCYDFNLLKLLFKNVQIKPKVVQNRFYQETGYDKKIRLFCQENDIMYQSFWSLSANPHLLQSSLVKNLAKKYNKTSPQIFYKFLQSIGITPLNGTTSKVHMLEDLSIKDFDLTSEEVQSIENLL